MPGAAYFPTETGLRRIWHVIDSGYNSTGPGGLVVERFYMLEAMESIETDLEGRQWTIAKRFTSPDSLGDEYQWQYLDQVSYLNDGQVAERQEGNMKTVALQFPASPGRSWNGNLYMADRPETYHVSAIDTSLQMHQQRFDAAIFVLEIPKSEVDAPDAGFYRHEHAYSIYAAQAGRIKHYRKIIERQNNITQAFSRVRIETLHAIRH